LQRQLLFTLGVITCIASSSASAPPAAVTAGALVPATGAAGAPAPPLKLDGAYLYLDHLPASKQQFVRVVFRTGSELPRRYDGLIRAGVAIDGVGRSIATARKGQPIYTGATEVKGGSIPSHRGGKLVRKGAKIGRTFTVRVSVQGGESVTKKLVLRVERTGDDAGKPLAR
jgi:hypothetical protein